MTILKATKIVATIGPKTESKEMLEKLVRAGMNVMRLNMSHGDHAEHGARIVNGKAVAQETGLPIAILLDLAGPKIRTGSYETDRITLVAGETLTLTTEDVVGTTERISVNYAKLPQEVKEGTVIMLDDGKKELKVESVSGNDIVCRVIVGGELKARRGVNVPGAYLTIDTITEKDRADLVFGLDAGVDFVALSFVRRAEDVRELRALMEKHGRVVPIIVKIETQEAIENLDAILAVADGAMVARGDLAIEVPTEFVPRYQKDIIKKANALGKPVITATQMLESMIHSPVPTRAEVSDIANAIFDGTDAVMLSEESTLGSYPIEAVSMMTRIARANERPRTPDRVAVKIPDAIHETVVETAAKLGAVAIVAMTESGATAQMTARFNPGCPIVALTPRKETVQKLALVGGVLPFLVEPLASFEDSLRFVPTFLIEKGIAKTGDIVVVTAGLRFGVEGSTNLLIAVTV